MLGDVSEQSNESHGPLLSVRSEVERIVDPDSAVLNGQISIARETKEEALRAAAIALASLKEALQDLGGTVDTASTHVLPLTWSTQRIITMPEYDNSLRSNTGRTVANVTVHLSLRDFSLLEQLEEMVATQEHFRLMHASWSVDADNPSWNTLRNEAIQEALRKGMDYAAALGSNVVSVEHVADLGLLGGDEPEHRARGGSVAAMGGGGVLGSCRAWTRYLRGSLPASKLAFGSLPYRYRRGLRRNARRRQWHRVLDLTFRWSRPSTKAMTRDSALCSWCAHCITAPLVQASVSKTVLNRLRACRLCCSTSLTL
jgi:uncharacterized protein YggE